MNDSGKIVAMVSVALEVAAYGLAGWQLVDIYVLFIG